MLHPKTVSSALVTVRVRSAALRVITALHLWAVAEDQGEHPNDALGA